MRKIIVFSLICLFVIFTQAQNKKVENTRKIVGTVTDFYGVPWADATIKLKAKGEYYKSSNVGKETNFERETKTDNNGYYSFANLPEDLYEITLLRIGTTLEETKQTGLLLNEKTYKFDFGVEVGTLGECQFFVSGFVKDDKGKAIDGAKISTFNAFNQRNILSAITDKKGFYQITLCSLGQYIVFSNTPKYGVQTANVTFQTRKDYLKNVDFNLNLLPQNLLNWRK